MPAGHYRRWLSPGNFLSGEIEELDFPGGGMPFERSKLAGSYILELLNVRDPTFIYRDPPGGRQVSLSFAEVPFVTIWSDGGPFLCIEPCWGLTDHHQQRPFEDKAGIQRIEAGGELRAGFSMVPELTATSSR
jgi:galactose mutarotase-like enzyme